MPDIRPYLKEIAEKLEGDSSEVTSDFDTVAYLKRIANAIEERGEGSDGGEPDGGESDGGESAKSEVYLDIVNTDSGMDIPYSQVMALRNEKPVTIVSRYITTNNYGDGGLLEFYTMASCWYVLQSAKEDGEINDSLEYLNGSESEHSVAHSLDLYYKCSYDSGESDMFLCQFADEEIDSLTMIFNYDPSDPTSAAYYSLSAPYTGDGYLHLEEVSFEPDDDEPPLDDGLQ